MPLESLLKELARKGFIGRLVFDGIIGDLGKILLRIEVVGEKIVALEAESGGRLLKGPEAVPILEKALKEGEGFVEIIELDTDRVMIDLDENPDAVVNIVIPIEELTLKFRVLHGAAKNSLALFAELISDISFSECLILEGMINSECNGVVKGEVCPDKISVEIHTEERSYSASSIDELKGVMSVISEKCGMIEVIMKRTE